MLFLNPAGADRRRQDTRHTAVERDDAHEFIVPLEVRAERRDGEDCWDVPDDLRSESHSMSEVPVSLYIEKVKVGGAITCRTRQGTTCSGAKRRRDRLRCSPARCAPRDIKRRTVDRYANEAVLTLRRSQTVRARRGAPTSRRGRRRAGRRSPARCPRAPTSRRLRAR